MFAIDSPHTFAQNALEKSMGKPFPARIRAGSLTMKRWKIEKAHERMSSRLVMSAADVIR